MGLFGLGGKSEPAAASPEARSPEQVFSPGTAAANVIVDVTIETFKADVIDASMTMPVFVDFWAPWCGPCKQLTPVLEKQIKAAGGKVRLAKINIDENPEIAQQLQVQSVPTVFIFVRGQPVTGFQGVQPESQIKMLIEKLVGEPLGQDPADAGIEHAQALMQAGDLQAAAGIFQQIVEQEPANVDAIAGLTRCLVGAGQFDDAQSVLDKAPSDKANANEISGARASLALAREAGDLGDPKLLQALVERNPDDHESRSKLATALFLRGEIEASMEHLCEIIGKDREWNEDGARKQLVQFFDALGPTHQATIKGRRRLSRLLFS